MCFKNKNDDLKNNKNNNNKNKMNKERKREREVFYLTTHSTHFIYGYMAWDIWLRTIMIVRKETRCRHIGYSYRLTARVLLYAPSHRQDNTYHGLCYTSRGALAGTEIAQWVHPMKDWSDDPSHHERRKKEWMKCIKVHGTKNNYSQFPDVKHKT